MKSQLNQITGIASAGEIKLFSEMQRILNHNGKKSVFCRTVHQHYVKFVGPNGTIMRREIADLLLVSLDYATKRARISFLQAKRRKGSLWTLPKYKFHGDFGQFFLLKNRPILMPGVFPPSSLRFSPACSLTTYGVFYNDVNDQIDFLYSAANYLNKNSSSTIRGNLELDTSIVGNLPILKQYIYDGMYFDELIAVDGIDAFEKDLVAWKIGAVLPVCCQDMILYHLFRMGLNMLGENRMEGYVENDASSEEHRIILRSLAHDFDINIDDDNEEWSKFDLFSFPSIMFVGCDSKAEHNERMD